MFRLDGKVAIVTGGSSGIGRAIALRFRDAGARVVVFDRAKPADPLSDVSYRHVDVSDEPAVAAAIGKVAEAHGGRLDILVNNAGIQPLGPTLAETSTELIEQTFRVNVHGVLHGLRHGPRWMRDGGRILNTASFIAVRAAPKASAYGLSKHAIVYLTRVAAIELAPRRITVNCVCPATANTPAVAGIVDNPELRWAQRVVPLGRIAEPAEVAAAFHYLASDEAAYITGQALTVDGGATAGFADHDVVPPPQLRNGRWCEDAGMPDDAAPLEAGP